MSTILISSLFETIDESQYDYRSSSLQSLGLQDFQTSRFGNSSVEALGLQGYRVWGLGLRVSTHTLSTDLRFRQTHVKQHGSHQPPANNNLTNQS